MPRQIIIHIADDGSMDVEENGMVCGGLGWDEVLGQVAAMTIPDGRRGPQGLFRMQTREQWEAEHKAAYERGRDARAGLPID